MVSLLLPHCTNRTRIVVERNHQRQKDIIAEQLARNRLDRNYMHGCHDLHKDVFMQSMILLGFNMGTAGTAFLITYFATGGGLQHRWALALVPAVVGIATSALGGFVIYNNQRSQKPDPNFRRV